MLSQAICSTSIPGMTPKRGKVRDIYDFGDTLLLVSTEAGRAFAARFDGNPQVQEVDIQAVLQPNLQTPTVAHKYATRFERLYLKHGFDYVLRNFGKDSWNHHIAEKIVKFKKKWQRK